MKNILKNFLLFIFTLILLGIIVFLVYAIYIDLVEGETIQSVHSTDTLIAIDDGSEVTSTKEKKSIGETITDIFTSKNTEEPTYSTERSQGKYFYEQLNENQKILYNGLQENKSNLISGNYSIQFGNKFYDTLSKENGSEILGNDYQSAIEAFTHDNPDLFYIDVSKLYLNMETKKIAFNTTYNVYIQAEEGKNYYAKGFNSPSDVRIALNKIESVKNVVKAKLTGDTYRDIKIIHDYLIDNIEYDQKYESLGCYTIYGALVDKKCVCEGYSRAFKYLADMAGINNILMQGTATNTEGKTENHAWNAVHLKGSWYLLDVTWDDPIILGRGIVFSSVHYKYFLKGTNTFYKDHKLETKFTKNGKVFKYPYISENNYN